MARLTLIISLNNRFMNATLEMIAQQREYYGEVIEASATQSVAFKPSQTLMAQISAPPGVGAGHSKSSSAPEASSAAPPPVPRKPKTNKRAAAAPPVPGRNTKNRLPATTRQLSTPVTSSSATQKRQSAIEAAAQIRKGTVSKMLASFKGLSTQSLGGGVGGSSLREHRKQQAQPSSPGRRAPPPRPNGRAPVPNAEAKVSKYQTIAQPHVHSKYGPACVGHGD